MLVELRVRDLGVVEDAALILSRGMTAITGETGAGKTLLTEAIRLLMGGRSEAHIVRNGAQEAWVEGRFVIDASRKPVALKSNDDDAAADVGEVEVVLTRVIAAQGRSRAYVDGRMVPLSVLAEAGEELVDLHGQNAHQTLLSAAAQRKALDSFGGIDTASLVAARRRISAIDHELAGYGGDEQSRMREVDLLRFQLEELDAAELTDANEDERLLAEETALADVGNHRQVAAGLHEALTGDDGVLDRLAIAVKASEGHAPLNELNLRLKAVSAEVSDVSADSAVLVDGLEDNPARLAAIQERRSQLKTLQRKYGPSLAEVIAFHGETSARLDELQRHEEIVAELERQKQTALDELAAVEAVVATGRRSAAPQLAAEVQTRLRSLALPNARLEVRVEGPGAADEITYLLGPNPGMPLLPLAKAASGGELARTMLALRLALLSGKNSSTVSDNGADTLIFDEVDAGIGGEAAVAVGRSLGALAQSGGMAAQVLVVTHLPQVAAFADSQVTVEKQQQGDRTAAMVRVLSDDERERELARMLSGRPDSDSGRAHARELLDQRAQMSAAQSPVIDLRSQAKPSKRSSAKSAESTAEDKPTKTRAKPKSKAKT